METWKESLTRFLFPAESDRWLTVLRLGLGLQVTVYSLSLRNDWDYLLANSHNGLVSRAVAEAIFSTESFLLPRLGWIVTLGTHVGLGENTVLVAAWIGLLFAGCGLLLGVTSRFCAVLAWFLHLCAAKSGAFVSYGVDNFMTIGLFYLMLSPLPDRCSLDRRWRKARLQDAHLLGFYRRALQLHLCVIYFFGGLAKCLGSGWWNGSNIWRALTRPPFDIIASETLIEWKYVLPILGIFICLTEIGYPFFIWPKQSRLIWLLAIVAMHAAIGLTMGMYLFALIMIVLNMAAFAPGVFDFLNRANYAAPEVGAEERPSSPL